MQGKIAEKILLYKVHARKDPDAFAQLYDMYVKRIYRFVFFKVSSHEEAEDISSEVFLKAWNYISGENKNIESFSGLLYRLARNCVIDLYRSKSRKPELISSDEADVGDGGKWYAEIHAKADAEKVLKALKKLKQEYREVVTLRYVDELKIEEIAVIIGKGGVATRVTLHRAVKKLKELLVE